MTQLLISDPSVSATAAFSEALNFTAHTHHLILTPINMSSNIK